MSKKKRTRDEYMHGRPGAKYGIYNTVTKRFQFDIREDTPMLAEARLFQKIGDDAHKWRFEPRRLPPDGLTAKITLIDEMHEVKPIEPLPATKKASVHLYYSEEEAAMLFDLFHDEMEDLMSLSTKDRLSKEPVFNQEQRDYLHRVMRFCAEQMRALTKYCEVGDIEG